MRNLLLPAAAAALLALALAAPAGAGGPYMLVGAADDVVLQRDPAVAQARMDLLRLAGLDAVRVTAQWTRGDTALAPAAALQLENAADAARLAGIRVIVSLYPFGSSVTPLTDAERSDFAAWAADVVRRLPSVHDFVVGNEPNLNRFWMPQFDAAGADAAAPAYEALLATAYDAIKAVRAHTTVYGGALAPRGIDRPGSGRDTHSPTAFLLDLGAAYRASGRQVPIMDALAFHPYGENSSIPPSFQHPNSTSLGIADYRKLVALLGQAFDGTAQRGSSLPILYDEYGVESQIPAEKASLYTGTEPATIHPVDEATQAQFYAQALQLSFCEPTVMGLLFFHVVDEVPRAAWQSGLFYADLTPKASLAPVRAAVDRTFRGVVAQCPGLRLTPQLTVTTAAPVAGSVRLTLTSTLDARYTVALQRLGGGAAPTATLAGTTVGRRPRSLRYPKRLPPGRYRWRVTATALENAGPPASLLSAAFVVPPPRA